MNIHKYLLLAAAALTAAAMQAQVSFGKPEKFNDNWRFSLKADSTAAAPGYDDANGAHSTCPTTGASKQRRRPRLPVPQAICPAA